MKLKTTNDELRKLWDKWLKKYPDDDTGLFCAILDRYSCLDCPYNSKRGIDNIETMDCKLYGNFISDGSSNLKEYKRVFNKLSENLELI